MAQRIDRLDKVSRIKNIDAFLITSAASIKSLCGYYFYFETGSSPFQIMPAALLVVPSNLNCLILADNESLTTPLQGLEISVKPYSSYVFEKPFDFTNQFLTRLYEVINDNGLSRARIGIEQNSLPLVVAQSLTSRYPEIEFVDVTREIAQLRIIKDPDEIECISMAANLCDVGQSAVLKHARPGMTELELFCIVHGAMEAIAGTRVPLMVDLISGISTSSGGGIPTNNVIREGDLILSDLTPCLNGYWGDSCNTFAVSGPSSAQRKMFLLVKEALDIAINAVRPGVKAMEIDSLMRSHLGSFPHHGGHGVGTMYHEEPRITPYNEMELEPGMVIALEPAIYTADFGIRLEHLIVVTTKGCELLTKFRHTLE